MAVYYIDPLRGSERGDGLSPKAPKKSIKGIAVHLSKQYLRYLWYGGL